MKETWHASKECCHSAIVRGSTLRQPVMSLTSQPNIVEPTNQSINQSINLVLIDERTSLLAGFASH
jgi:hypothetical protein